VSGTDAVSIQVKENAGIFLKAALKFHLSAKRVCCQERITPEMFHEVILLSFRFWEKWSQNINKPDPSLEKWWVSCAPNPSGNLPPK